VGDYNRFLTAFQQPSNSLPTAFQQPSNDPAPRGVADW
jgi:hypothetical protein